jgi:oxalate decarboxylase/phosphoglucose isomerase-like protein (cupin superfamily)
MTPKKPANFTQRDLFGGSGAVDIWNLRTSNCPPFSASLWCSLEPSGVVGRHRQQDDPEIVICIAGEGVATVGKTEHAMVTGVMLYLPYGQVLSIENKSAEESLDYLIIKAKNK